MRKLTLFLSLGLYLSTGACAGEAKLDFEGTIGGETFRAVAGFARTTGESGVLAIDLVEASAKCVAGSPMIEPGVRQLSLVFRKDAAEEGDYELSPNLLAHEVSAVIVTWDAWDENGGRFAENTIATVGEISIRSIDAERVTGTADVSFGADDRLSGSFAVTWCGPPIARPQQGQHSKHLFARRGNDHHKKTIFSGAHYAVVPGNRLVGGFSRVPRQKS